MEIRTVHQDLLTQERTTDLQLAEEEVIAVQEPIQEVTRMVAIPITQDREQLKVIIRQVVEDRILIIQLQELQEEDRQLMKHLREVNLIIVRHREEATALQVIVLRQEPIALRDQSLIALHNVLIRRLNSRELIVTRHQATVLRREVTVHHQVVEAVVGLQGHLQEGQDSFETSSA